ncbi:MAG: outer membrane beta-barrel protein [Gallionella sp.]|jgi:OOP family OmpA-OmpF porin
MKKNTMTIALAAALMSVSVVQASEFDGFYIGGKAGLNKSDMTGVRTESKQNSTTIGIEEGYNWDMDGFLLGGSFFADFNQKTNHVTNIAPLSVKSGSTALGLDLKLGLPSGSFMPYAKLGMARTTGLGYEPVAQYRYTNGLHTGLGLEYKLSPSWSVAGEWTRATSKLNGSKLRNDNFTVGFNYYFGEPSAPVAVAAPAAVAPVVVAAQPAPVVTRAVPVAQPVSKKAVFAADSSADSLFDFGKANVKPAGKAAIDKFTADLKGADFEVIRVTGHTDRIGSKAFNMGLSTRRAEAVKAYLVQSAGIPADKIEAKGVDGSYPVSKSGECKGKKKTKKLIACLAPDRRVEVEVTATRTAK